jgi:hypothetical protein
MISEESQSWLESLANKRMETNDEMSRPDYTE